MEWMLNPDTHIKSLCRPLHWLITDIPHFFSFSLMLKSQYLLILSWTFCLTMSTNGHLEWLSSHCKTLLCSPPLTISSGSFPHCASPYLIYSQCCTTFCFILHGPPLFLYSGFSLFMDKNVWLNILVNCTCAVCITAKINTTAFDNMMCIQAFYYSFALVFLCWLVDSMSLELETDV